MAAKKRRKKDLHAALVVHQGVTEVVRLKGGIGLRIHASEAAARRAKVPAPLARLLFRADPAPGPGGDPCGGNCTLVSDPNARFVWCESTTCDVTRCECHLLDMWWEKGKPHGEDRGNPKPGDFPIVPGHFYRCTCKPVPPPKPKKRPKKHSKKTQKPEKKKGPPKSKPRPSPSPSPAPSPSPTPSTPPNPEPIDDPT